MRVTVRTLSSVALLLAAALLPSAAAFHVPSNPRQAQQQTRMMAGGGYQEQLARARAEKAARQAAAASGQPYQPPPPPPPPMARTPPPPAPAPTAPQQQAYQQPLPPAATYQQAPQAAAGLSGGTQDAVATLLAVLGERLASGRPLSPQRVQTFSQAAEALVAEARAAQAQQQAPVPAVPQYAPPPPQQQPPQQQYYSQPPQQPTTQPTEGFKAAGFEQDEDIPWQLGSRTLSGPQPGYRSASAFQAKSGFDEEGDDFSQGLPQPVTRGATTGTRSPFMQTLKGTPFYVDVDQQQVTPDEYRAIIGKRINEAQMARRRSGQAFGNEVSVSYMDDLNKKKQEMIRQRAQQQSQQWQQQVDQQQQQQQEGGAGGYYPQQ